MPPPTIVATPTQGKALDIGNLGRGRDEVARLPMADEDIEGAVAYDTQMKVGGVFRDKVADAHVRDGRAALLDYRKRGYTDIDLRLGDLERLISAMLGVASRDRGSKPGSARGRRAVNARGLVRSAGAYRRVYRGMKKVSTLPAGSVARVRAAREVHEIAAHHGLKPLPFELDELFRFERQDFAQANPANEHLEVAAHGELHSDSTATLETIASRPGLPTILTQTIREGLQGRDATWFVTGAASAGLRELNGKRWRITEMAFGQLGIEGTLELVAARLHELMHVAAGDAYANTEALLCVPRRASDEEIRDRVTQRRELSKQLVGLIADATDVPGYLKTALAEKAAYGAGFTGTSQPNKFAEYHNRILPTAAREEIATAAHVFNLYATTPIQPGEQANKSLPAGCGLDTLIEWDTTSPQMLLWCVWSGLPREHPIVGKLVEMCQRAYDDRAAARRVNAASQAYTH
ncbi:hypothetical protein GKE82_12390 [Conexibacter sp. W3-3-2]|uniref:hypothetical protein n=1 Tax=Conexibacter sp. W3-3-2 TaxID=2675227 RepID=UPI0012B7ACDB|nr:hypothetical protein [Conexibacter sp. W3-3-2]MTD45067.1 hypothetical protein [Conexibacter sp. W3-3-2]